MRDLTTLLLIATGFLLILIGSSMASIRWLDYQEGINEMKKTGKMMIIYIHSDHCQYCRKMEATTFKNRKVEEVLERFFVPVKVEKNSEEGLNVRKIYGYMGTPTFHFIQPDGKKVYSLFGAWNEKEFLEILRYFYEGHYREKTLTEYFMK
ncbi:MULTISPECIES: thioredoxin family protein [Persephonella]|uniref:Thioredoxin n=1 Tax=Persephonella marina (strain DSM 14350 / EX-H1) TaxID=123214 RepID=C0QSK8_PERMH|nr:MULTISPECIES: thioredoxin family protein [Persephonella]ACO04732.1 thioredoxin [Persephonella marina EX-H1]